MGGSEAMRIVLVDDHPLVWQGIKAVLATEPDLELVGWAGNGADAEAMVLEKDADLVLVDLRLPGESGLDIIRRLKPKVPLARFVVLTTSAEQSDITEAMNLGVDGYILKEAMPEEMLTGIRLVAKGRPYYDPVIMQILLTHQSQKDRVAGLTERELDVLQELARGLSNREIATKLFITEYTVKKHVSGILSKLDLKDRTQAALFAVEHGVASSGQ
ncbi:MAG: response regulator [Bacillota bacterium]